MDTRLDILRSNMWEMKVDNEVKWTDECECGHAFGRHGNQGCHAKTESRDYDTTCDCQWFSKKEESSDTDNP